MPSVLAPPNSPLSKPLAQANGRRCDRYAITRPLQKIPQQRLSVYLGHDRSTRKSVLLCRQRLTHIEGWKPVESQTFLAAVRQRLQTLNRLDYPQMPAYGDAFKAGDDLCWVQTAIPAKPLSKLQHFTPNDIQQIAISVLETLVVLHRHHLFLGHGGIRPETIWGNQQHQTYLINAALPPLEQPSRPASQGSASADFYHLGLTLMSCLTQTPFDELVVKASGGCDRRNLRSRIPTDFSLAFIDWLDTMVQPNRQDQYSHADAALLALENLTIQRHPQAELSPAGLSVTAIGPEQILQSQISIQNKVPDTVLAGAWEIQHPEQRSTQTPQYSDWLAIRPSKFKANQVNCRVTVDTRPLRLNRVYRRRLLLHQNGADQPQAVELRIKTGKLITPQPAYGAIAILLCISLIAGGLAALIVGEFGWLGWSFWLAGLGLGLRAGWATAFSKYEVLTSTCLMTAMIGSAMAFLGGGQGNLSFGGAVEVPTDSGAEVFWGGSGVIEVGLLGYMVGFLLGGLVAWFAGDFFQQQVKRQFPRSVAGLLGLLTASLGLGGGVGWGLETLSKTIPDWGQPVWLGAFALWGLIMATQPIKHWLKILKYQWSERNLIRS